MLLVVGCSLGYAGLDVLRKQLVERLSPLALVFYLTAGHIPVLFVWALTTEAPRFTWLYFVVTSGAVMLNIMANVAFVEAIRVSELSVTVPLLSLTPAFATTFAVFIVGEVLDLWQVAGVVLVVLGAIYLHTAKVRRTLRGWLRSLIDDRGSLLMVLVAVCWSLSMPLDKIGLVIVGPAWHALFLSLGVAAGILAILVWFRWTDQLFALGRDQLPRLGLAVVVSAAAVGMQLVAMRFVYVGIVETVKRAVGNFAALGFGRALFGEAVTSHKVVALAMMALGVVFILA